jgi:hypothetical protein
MIDMNQTIDLKKSSLVFGQSKITASTAADSRVNLS